MSDEVSRRILAAIGSIVDIPPDELTEDTTFDEMGIDSLDGFNMLFMLEEEFNITISSDQAGDLRTVRQVIEGIKRELGEKS